MKDGFLARPVIFMEAPGYAVAGYMVEQYHKGQKLVEQFIPKEAYAEFCNAIGTVPTMEGKEKRTV